MKKRKILTYETLNGEFNYDLGLQRLTFTHNDLSFSNSYIPLRISHEYQISEINNGYGKGFKLNLEQQLVKVDTDTYKLIQANGTEEVFDELYYIKNDTAREYILKDNVIVLPNGTLEYDGRKVYKELKNNKGISLSGDYTTFINNEKMDFRNQELIELENSILQIKQTIENLDYNIYEYSKFNNQKYNSFISKQEAYENNNFEYSSIKSSSEYINNINKLYAAKNEYYNQTKKEIKAAGGLESQGITRYTYNQSLNRMSYSNSDAYNADLYGTYAKYNDETKNVDGETVSLFDEMSTETKASSYFSQKYQHDIDVINQNIQDASNFIEQATYEYQNSLSIAEYDYLVDKKAYEEDALEKQKAYYERILPLTIKLKSYYEKLLYSKEYEKKELIKLIPKMYLSSSDGLIYGFNESGNLCIMFDSFEHQIAIQYNDLNRIKNVIDEKGNSINFIYNDSNNLIKIYESQGNYISYEYDENEFLVKIIYSDDNVSTLEYNSGYLYKYIDINMQGYYIQYMSGEITHIRDLFIKSDNSQINDHIDYFTYDDCHVSVSNNKNDLVNNYIFDENKYIVTEYNTIDGEIDSISMHENHDKCCSFDMTYNKNHQKQVLASSLTLDSTNSRKVGYTVDLFNDYSTDYVLYAFADGDATLPYQRHKTKYCNVTSSVGWLSRRFELSCIIKYDGLDDIEYAVSFNNSISGKQFAALPITLEEDETGKLINPTSITVYADFSGNTTSCEITDFTLALGDYVYSEYNEAYNKTSDYYSEAVTPKTVMGEKQGYYINKRKIDYTYNYNELLESQVEAIYYEEYDLSSNLVSSDTKITTKSYKYNSNNKIAKEEDSKGNIIEYLYNDQGLCIMKKSYYKSLPNEAYIEECEYDENGKLIKEANSLGYNEEYKYINESNKIITTPNGNILNINSTNNCDSISAEADGIDNYNNSVYELSRLIEYNTEGMKYSYTYDDYGREKELYINDKLYSTFSYLETSSTISYKTLYPNNSGFEKVTDKYGNTLRINKITSNTTIEYIKYELDSLDRVIKETKYINGNEYITIYNYIDNTLASIQTNDYTKSTNYDMYNKELETTYQINNNQIKYKSEYNDDILNKYSVLYNNEVLYQEQLKLDKLNRLVNKTNTLLSDNYTYLSKNGRATNLISLNQKNINGNIQRYKYSYDKEGNIISKEENHSSTRYTYDSLNRLIREDNKSFNKTYIYTYDSNGNILSRGIYDYSLNDILENEEIIRYNYNDFNDY
ncbi:MAG: hypothetical protein ACI35S_03480, partial [Anaeroplasma sp.]